jgi:hypothetical protein
MIINGCFDTIQSRATNTSACLDEISPVASGLERLLGREIDPVVLHRTESIGDP